MLTKCWRASKGKDAVIVVERYVEKLDILWNGTSWSGTS